MAAATQNEGGFLSEEDLRSNRAKWRKTIGLDYRDHRVVTAAPPSTAWAALVRLGVMARYDVGPAGHNTTAYVHAATEISKRVSTTTRRFAADPEEAPTPLGRLLSDEYLERESARVDPNAVAPYDPPAQFDTAATCSPTGYRPTGYPDPQQHTTHFVVADREGNVVSATQTLGNVFGSKVMPEGTGIWLNDALARGRASSPQVTSSTCIRPASPSTRYARPSSCATGSLASRSAPLVGAPSSRRRRR
jgi:gamma-glutamyltranspeptidase/glutathione hydrolase